MNIPVQHDWKFMRLNGFHSVYISGDMIMRNFLNTIIQKASLKKAVLFTVLFAIFYALINYSALGVAGLLKITGGANILDFEFGYSYKKAYDILTALGADGRAFYQAKIIPIDFPFPLSYMLFYSGFIALLIKYTKSKEIFKYLLFLPLVATLFDWIENIGIIAMLNCYPSLPGWAVLVSSIFGMLKTVFTIGSITLIAILFVLFVYSKIRRK